MIISWCSSLKLGFAELLGSMNLWFSSSLCSFWLLLIQILFLPTPLFSPLLSGYSHDLYVRPLETVPQLTDSLNFSGFLFSLCV